MQLTRFTDYSLRMLIFLALEPERMGRIEEISESYGISKAHLMKVARELGREGFVEPVRGRGGGLLLAVPAEEIRIGDVVRRCEENLALVECFAEDGACTIDTACSLRRVLNEALEAFLAVLDDYTLADLLKKRRKLSRLLQIA